MNAETPPVSDFRPVCKHRFGFRYTRELLMIFKCLYCGLEFSPYDVCKMLDESQLDLTRIVTITHA